MRLQIHLDFHENALILLYSLDLLSLPYQQLSSLLALLLKHLQHLEPYPHPFDQSHAKCELLLDFLSAPTHNQTINQNIRYPIELDLLSMHPQFHLLSCHSQHQNHSCLSIQSPSLLRERLQVLY